MGTFGIIINTSLVLVQLILQRENFTWIKFLQVPLCIIAGLVTNLMYYHVFTFEVTSYAMRLFLLLLSFAGLAVFVGCMTLLDVITMPLEAVCYVIENKTGFSFAKSRMAADIICIVTSLALSFIFSLSFKIREGTVIGFVLLGPLMNLMMKLERKIPFIQKLII